MSAALDLLRRLEPHLGALVCYASTTSEYEPNKLVQEVRALLDSAAPVEAKPIGIWEQYSTPGFLTFIPEWRLRWYDRAPGNNTELYAAQPSPVRGDASHQQGRAAGIQEAAKAAENVGDGIHDRSSCAAYSCAAAIRALNKQEPTA